MNWDKFQVLPDSDRGSLLTFTGTSRTIIKIDSNTLITAKVWTELRIQ